MSRTRCLDTRGTVCPLPLLMAVREMLRMEIGDTLELVGDDPGILEDVPAWAELNGHRVLAMEEAEDGTVTCRVEKGDDGFGPEPGVLEEGEELWDDDDPAP